MSCPTVGGPDQAVRRATTRSPAKKRLAATRAAVEAGLVPRSRQVSQTGQAVHPRLYIGCGDSGALQHLVGMRTARTVRRSTGIPRPTSWSVIVRMNKAGEVVDEARIDNDGVALAGEVAKAGPAPEAAIEATAGWYWAVDVLEELGVRVQWAILGSNQ